MLVFHGTSLYGKVDQVKGLFHVATLFFHMNWVPLIPKASYLVFEGAGGKRSGALPIRLSGKSILFAWGRCAALLGGCLVLPVALAVAAAEERGQTSRILGLTALLMPVVSIVLLVLSYRVARARPERALELARLAGVGPEQLAEFFAEHLSPEEEDRLRNLAAEQVDSPQSTS